MTALLRRRRYVWQAWLSTLCIGLAMVLLAFGHMRSSRAHGELLVLLDQIGIIRQSTLLAQLHAERHAAGNLASGVDLVRASLQRALQTSRDIELGQGSLRGMLRSSRPEPNTLEAVQALEGALLHLDTLLANGQSLEAPEISLATRAAQRNLESRLARLESEALQGLDATRSELLNLTILNLLLLTISGILLLLWQRRSGRRAELKTEQIESQAAELQAFAAAIPDISFLMDSEGRFLRAHASRPDLLLVPIDRIEGRALGDFFPPEQAQAFSDLIAQALREGQALAEYRLVVGGQEHVFEARVCAVQGTDRVVWVTWDVTDRVRKSERIEQLGRLFGMLSACNQAMVFSSNEKDLFNRVLEAAVHTAGYAAAWIAATPPPNCKFGPSCVAACSPEHVRPLIESLLNSEDSPLLQLLKDEPPPLRVHSRRVSPSPGLAWAAAAEAAGLFGLSQVCVGEVEGQRRVLVLHASTPFDLEPEHQALLAEVGGDLDFALRQLQLKAQGRRLQARLELQVLALNSSRDGILLLDASGRVLSANPAACEFSGSKEEAVLGEPARLLTELKADPECDRQMHDALDEVGFWQGELLARHASGRLHTLLLSASRVDGGESASSAAQVLVFTDITRQRETDARLRRIAHFDALTGLPNRDLLLVRLQVALQKHREQGRPGAALMLDLDNFRTFNESAGWSRGDELLKLVALRLGEVMRAGDTLARMGGDEFVMVLEGLESPSDVESFAESVQTALRPPLQMGDGERIYTQASIGVIRFEDCAGDAEDTLSRAEVALFEAKRDGRNRWRRYLPAMGESALQRLSLENRLREALQHQQLKLVYQPLVDLKNGALVGVEALVRLDQPDLPQIGPDDFIPVLEQTGLISQLGEWVTIEACLQARRWLDAGWDFGSVAVNLSPAEVGRGQVQDRVRRALEQSGLPPERLELEITESGLMEQGEHAETFLRELAALGVNLSIDDFGTGYSSLASLKRFPVRKLKIDRSFITDLEVDANDAVLVEAIIGVGAKLRIQVLAEGVETEAQRQFLEQRGCLLAQGYLFSRPLSPADLFSAFGPGGQAGKLARSSPAAPVEHRRHT